MRTLALLLTIALLAACGGEAPAPEVTTTETVKPAAAPPTTEEASTLVASSPAFGDYQFSTGSSFSLPLDASMMNEPARQGAADLENAGWIRIDGGRVTLAKGDGDKRFLLRPNGFLDVVPLAKKELISVDAVRPAGAAVEVDFTWRWIPNEVGSSFTRGAVKERFDATHRATAKLQDFGAGWDVMAISESKH